MFWNIFDLSSTAHFKNLFNTVEINRIILDITRDTLKITRNIPKTGSIQEDTRNILDLLSCDGTFWNILQISDTFYNIWELFEHSKNFWNILKYLLKYSETFGKLLEYSKNLWNIVKKILNFLELTKTFWRIVELSKTRRKFYNSGKL